MSAPTETKQKYKPGVEHTALGTCGMPPLYGDFEATCLGVDGGPEAEILRERGEHSLGQGLGQLLPQGGAFR